MPNTCEIDDCDNKVFGHGYCNKHYKRWRKYGDPLGSAPQREVRLCDFPDCGRTHGAHGLCDGHAQQMRAGRDLSPLRPRNVTDQCARPDCSQLGVSNGYCHRHYSRAYKLTRSCGGSVESVWREVDAVFDAQDGCCAICAKELTLDSKEVHIDHCHKKGRIRGVLCQHCNQGLGQFGDNADLLRRASEYV